MKKRIYLYFLCLILATALLLAVSLCLYYYSEFRSREISSISDSRITVIAPDGTVMFDNQAASDTLGNHGDRIEVADALRHGAGEATRYSDTLLAETYYYAVRLNDGNVLRLARTANSVAGVFGASLPTVLAVTAVILFLAVYLARRLTEKIVKPLDSIDFDGGGAAVYEELSPYARKIEEQRREISTQIATLKNRADTIFAITENMREGIILIDGAGTALAANKTVAGLFGETATRNIRHICRDEGFGHGVSRCLSGETAEATMIRNGRTYGVRFSPVPSEPRGAVILFFDITELIEAENARREFSANVSHELKTPLTSISALSEMIGNGMARDEDIKGFAAKISEQAVRLIDIIDDIIKLSEFDEGRPCVAREAFDILGLCESVADALRENTKGVAIHIVGERLELTANRRMIEELLYNLVDNGIKYNHDGGSVTVTLSQEGMHCRIDVSDTGIGISKEHQSHVFERFYRADKSRSKKTGGTGLGLSIVKHIAESHGGTVELSSAENSGTTVTCRIASRAEPA